MAVINEEEIWTLIERLWKNDLGGKISLESSSPKHGYKLYNDKLEKPALFIELRGAHHQKARKQFKRFYILRRYDKNEFVSEIGKLANAVDVQLQRKSGRPAGLNCDIQDWLDWKATVMGILTWAWIRDK